MPPIEDTPKPKRAQLKHVLLDVNFKDKPKVIELEAMHSPLARLLYMDMQAAMSAATNARISKRVPLVLGARIGLSPEKVNVIVDFCLEAEMLIEEEGQLTSKRVIEDQEKLFKDQERWKQNNGKKKVDTCGARAAHVREARKSEGTTDLYICRSEDLNIDLNKNSKPPDAIQPQASPKLEIGLIRLGEYVRISEISQEQFITNCNSEGFTDKDRQEIIDALDRWYSKNLHSWHEKDHFRDLMNWPFKNQREHKAKMARSRGDPKPAPKISELKKQWIKEGRYKAN